MEKVASFHNTDRISGNALRWLFQVTGTLLITIVFTACSEEGVDCANARDQSPDRLFASNEYIVMGELLSVTTLADLGSAVRYGSEIEYYLIEYAITPNIIFKSPTNDSIVFLWYVTSLSRTTNHRSDIPMSTWGPELAYGNSLLGEGDLTAVLKPKHLVSVSDFRLMIDGIEENIPFNVDEVELILAHRLDSMTHLNQLLAERSEVGTVLYGTEYLYSTLFHLKDNRVVFCDSTTWSATKMDYEQYLDELKKLAGESYRILE